MKLSYCHHMIDHYKGLLHKIKNTMKTEFKLSGLSRPGSFTCIDKNDELFWATSDTISDDRFQELFKWAKSDDTFWKQDWRVLVQHDGFYEDDQPINPKVIEIYEAVNGPNT